MGVSEAPKVSHGLFGLPSLFETASLPVCREVAQLRKKSFPIRTAARAREIRPLFRQNLDSNSEILLGLNHLEINPPVAELLPTENPDTLC
jgi:hypothetical protein